MATTEHGRGTAQRSDELLALLAFLVLLSACALIAAGYFFIQGFDDSISCAKAAGGACDGADRSFALAAASLVIAVVLGAAAAVPAFGIIRQGGERQPPDRTSISSR